LLTFLSRPKLSKVRDGNSSHLGVIDFLEWRSIRVKPIETNMDSVNCRDTAKIVRELDNALAYNEKLASVASQADASDLVPGIGPVSVLGISTGSAYYLPGYKDIV
jgi:hypothetical protein